MTAQLDLFGAPVPEPKSPPAAAAAPKPARGPEPGARRFAEQHIGPWLRRAEQLRYRGVPGAEHQAHGLESAADRIAAIAAGGDRIEALRLSLAACQAYDHPEMGIRMNDGPIMDEVRARFEARIRAAAAEAGLDADAIIASAIRGDGK